MSGHSMLDRIYTHLDVTSPNSKIAVTLLTGGTDRPYVLGLATSLISRGVTLDLIASDELDSPALRHDPRITYLNLRGSSDSNSTLHQKVARILRYYLRLICYAASSRPAIFHILWNNKFELFDRTLLMFYYRMLRKKIVLTVHNVNMRKRDASDSVLNRLTLRIQYRLADHLFVHTEKMKTELIDGFGVRAARITVIPFGINNSLPNTSLTSAEAKRRLGLDSDQKAILFFGRITPYKGIDLLISAFCELLKQQNKLCLIIAGRVDRCETYWKELRAQIEAQVQNGSALVRDSFIPDDEAEIYFKAADVLILPYRDIYQSGVLFTGQHFGIPILAADVGSFGDDIVEGKTGFVFRPEDPEDLARTIKRYFQSDLYAELPGRREEIRAFADEGHSWDHVGDIVVTVYQRSSQNHLLNEESDRENLEMYAGKL
jgi:glycosyltransferase involved in cell wall biosynthesis